MELVVVVEGDLLRHALLQVIFVAVDEEHDVRVLLDRARFAEIRKLRPLVLAALDGARELGEREHRNRKLLRDRLQPLRDLADLEHAVLGLGAGGRPHQLQIVDDDEREPLGALEPAAARAERGEGDRGRVVDMDRQGGDLAAHLHELVEILLPDLAAADVVAGDAAFLGEQACRELLGAHLERENRDAALRQRIRPVPLRFRHQRAGRAEPHLDGERGFAHAGAPGEDEEIGGMHAAELGIDIAQPGRQAGDVAGAAEGALGALDRIGERALEGDEPALRPAARRELEQRLLRGLDLLAPFELRFHAEGAVHHGLAEIDELAPQPGIVHRAAVFAGIDDADHGGEELREIGGAADLVEDAGMLEFRLQGDAVGELALLDPARDGLVDAAMDRVREMLGDEEFRDALIGLVVRQQRAEQRLFGLQVRGRQALREAEERAVDRVHARTIADPARGVSRPCLWTAVDIGDGWAVS